MTKRTMSAVLLVLLALTWAGCRDVETGAGTLPEPEAARLRLETAEKAEIEMEWDVVGCASFKEEAGKWSKLRPGELVPT